MKILLLQKYHVIIWFCNRIGGFFFWTENYTTYLWQYVYCIKKVCYYFSLAVEIIRNTFVLHYLSPVMDSFNTLLTNSVFSFLFNSVILNRNENHIVEQVCEWLFPDMQKFIIYQLSSASTLYLSQSSHFNGPTSSIPWRRPIHGARQKSSTL